MNYPDKALFERLITGQVCGEAKGNSIYKFINKLRDEGIYCKDQKIKEDTLYFTAKRYHRKAVRRIAEEYGIELTLTEKPSLAGWICKYRKRFGIPIGILLGAGLLIYCSNVVMVIEIQGNENVSDKEILSALDECSVRRGTFIGDIDLCKSEIHVRSCFDEIAWIGMRHTGNRLVVEVMETNVKPEMLSDRIPCHIVAGKTAQITHTNISSGQLVKKAGEAVKEGEVIVNGIITDDYGHVKFYHSAGSVTGVYQEEVTFLCQPVITERNFSGNILEEKTLDIFSLRVPLTFEENTFNEYNVKLQKTNLTLFGKTLPISIDRKLYMEYESTEKILDKNEMKENLNQQLKRYEENFLSECRIIERKCTVTEKKTAMVMTVFYTLEGEIGREKELFLKDNRKPYVIGSKKE